MSHGNGKIYIDSAGGVSIGDIQAILATDKNDIGQLCRDDSVNMFAKFKPVRYQSVSATHDTVPTLYRGRDNDCGIKIPVLDATAFADPDVQDEIENSLDYIRTKPRGLEAFGEWFRFLDFDGYDHYASMNFQFIPPAVSREGYINIYGQHVFTLRVGNLYTKSGTISAPVLSLVDLMMRFTSDDTFYAYDESTAYSSNNGVNNDTSYGYLGIILVYKAFDNATQVCLCSHSLGIHSADNNELTVDFSTVYEDSGAPQPRIGDTVFLAPCFTNLNSGGSWVALISGTSYPVVKCGLFPKVSSGSSSVDFVSYTLYTPVVTLAELSFSVFGASLLPGYTTSYKVTQASASFVGVTVTAGTGVLGTGNTCRITNVNSSYSGAVGNTIIQSITFDANRQASFQINLADSGGHSIFIADYVPIQLQILSQDGEYQNDTIQIFSHNYTGQ